jgi:hypothetical protein
MLNNNNNNNNNKLSERRNFYYYGVGEFTALKVSRLCPLVLLVKVGW